MRWDDAYLAHRPSTMRAADMIFVMHAGKIVERGDHAGLMAQRGAYYSMARA